jgi:ABC-2 type transport system permease protein
MCSLFVPREELAPALEAIAHVLPLNYAFDAPDRLTTLGVLGRAGAVDVVAIVGSTLAALASGATTLRRRTR